MFCMNCGTQLADDAMFCLNCGAKVNNESQEINVATQTVSAPVISEPPVQPVMGQQMYQQPMYAQNESYNQQPFYGQAYVQSTLIKPKKTSKATVPAVIFAILSVILSSMVCLFGFIKKNDLGMGLENVAFIVCSVLVIIYAVSNTKITGFLKGIGFIAVAALHTAYYCIPAAKEASIRLSEYFKGNEKATGTDCFYGIILIAFIAFFAIYMLINVLKSFMNSKKR